MHKLGIQENVSLKEYTTFKIGGPARYFVEVKSVGKLQQVLEFAKKKNLEIFILGSGSNILVSDRGFDGLVIRVLVKGVEIVDESHKIMKVKIGAGEVWDDVVKWVVENRLWGIENLSCIPGLSGSAAVQNIGAYGQEISDVFDLGEVYDRETSEVKVLRAEECAFGYRRSIFRNEEKGRYIILNITLRLIKNGKPNLIYGSLLENFKDTELDEVSIEEIRELIIRLRTNKFPDLSKEGTVGSMFENVYLSKDEYNGLVSKVDNTFYLEDLRQFKEKFSFSNGIKIPVAFIIDKVCGLRGLVEGGVKIYDKQVLVFVSDVTKTKAHDVLNLMKKVCDEVYDKTGIKLENEPDLVGFSKEELEGYFRLT